MTLTLLWFSLNIILSLQKVEGRVASDQDLKLTELLRYYMRDIQAAKVRHVHLLSSHSLDRFITIVPSRCISHSTYI